MSTNGFPLRSNEPEAYIEVGYWTGAAAASPTKIVGSDLTLTWVSTGLYTLGWARPGAKLASLPHAQLAANTAINVAGVTVSFDYDSYSAANRTIQFIVYGADNTTLTNLATTMGIGLIVPLKVTGVAG